MSFRAARTLFALGASILLLAIAIWIVVPVPLLMLLPLGVAAPEISAWLLAVALLVAATALFDARGHRPARVALIMACAAAVLAATPLVRAALATPRLDAAMRAGLGNGFLDRVPSDVRQGMRPAPIVAGDLFRGFQAPEPRATSSVVFSAVDGTPLRMDVYAAATAGPHPAIVQIYGGAWQQGEPRDNAAFAAYFAARQYVVFAIDYRHAPRWRWPAQIEDVRTALSWIQRHGAQHGADVSRIALVGRSAGAHLALLAAYSKGAPPISAVVSLYGPTDLARGFREPPRPDPLDVRSVLQAFIGGTPDDRPAAYRAASPLTYAAHPQPPTLLIYGGRDHVVQAYFGAALDTRLRATGTQSVLLVLPWAEHSFDAVPFGPGGQLALYHSERFLAWALHSTRQQPATRPPEALTGHPNLGATSGDRRTRQ
jgi:acetyl esterase/lipase